MKIISGVFLALVCLCGCSSVTPAAPSAAAGAPAGQAAFDRLKTLAGAWETAPDKDGEKVRVEYKTSTNGQILVETLFPNTSDEMISVYFLDRGTLAMTHYCLLGNQPFLKAVSSDNNSVLFEYVGGTNIINPDKDPFMSEMKLTYIDDNHIKAAWRSRNMSTHPDKDMDLTRVKKDHCCGKKGCPFKHHEKSKHKA